VEIEEMMASILNRFRLSSATFFAFSGVPFKPIMRSEPDFPSGAILKSEFGRNHDLVAQAFQRLS